MTDRYSFELFGAGFKIEAVKLTVRGGQVSGQSETTFPKNDVHKI